MADWPRAALRRVGYGSSIGDRYTTDFIARMNIGCHCKLESHILGIYLGW